MRDWKEYFVLGISVCMLVFVAEVANINFNNKPKITISLDPETPVSTPPP